MRFWALPFYILGLTAMYLPPAHAAPLQSPWDAFPVKATRQPYNCPATVPMPVDFVTNNFYADHDPTHSIIDPVKAKAYAETATPVKHNGEVVVAAADAYRTTGSLGRRPMRNYSSRGQRPRRCTHRKMSSNQALRSRVGPECGGDGLS
jgi:poly(beta-D-mannuronate) lyase